jgi:dTDP-glucose 4,6-dehydratase
MKVIVTGGAGFIGSSLVRLLLKKNFHVFVIDNLTYAGNLENLKEVESHPNFQFEKANITDTEKISNIFKKFIPDAIMNLAAETHVDNSISNPKVFIETNVTGTFVLLEATRKYLDLEPAKKNDFRFVHISTDEVFGSLGDTGYFTEETHYKPNSPYSASKAASDHLVRAWFHTYKVPTIITNCSNNYGPRQFPEKLIPLMILNALKEKPLPVYGNGKNVRDWIHVDDHANGLFLALTRGVPGENYCFGGRSERKNLEVVEGICRYLDEVKPRQHGKKYAELINFVTDRAGHDWRYAIDDTWTQSRVGFERQFGNLEDGLKNTVDWYIKNYV